MLVTEIVPVEIESLIKKPRFYKQKLRFFLREIETGRKLLNNRSPQIIQLFVCAKNRYSPFEILKNASKIVLEINSLLFQN